MKDNSTRKLDLFLISMLVVYSTIFIWLIKVDRYLLSISGMPVEILGKLGFFFVTLFMIGIVAAIPFVIWMLYFIHNYKAKN